MNSYQKEQLDALKQVRKTLKTMAPPTLQGLGNEMGPYLDFRRDLEQFTHEHLGGHCTQACFKSQTSACCSKDGIITFWADVVINALISDQNALDELTVAIQKPMLANKCIYLADNGCTWKIRPLVCAMFLCDRIHSEVLTPDPRLNKKWQRFVQQAKRFRWPDRPVLFDHLEGLFMAKGCRSPLMYINTSPGLMRIKQSAGLKPYESL